MRYEQAKCLKRGEFKRLCGVYPETFEQMVAIVNQQKQHKQKEGRPSKLNSEDKVMMTLEYLREYRTYFHLAKDWGIHEATAYRIIRQVEQDLVNAKEFSLPGKKQLAIEELAPQTITIDVTEIVIEKPKKNKSNIIQEKRRDTL